MTDYDTLFADTAPDDTVFADKSALDPFAEPAEIHAREEQERQLATILNGLHEGYLPPTVSIYGPPGTGKTLTTRRVCTEFAARHDSVAVEYVNLKECRTLFSAANEIHLELTGEECGAYEGLDGVFAGIWTALADYPEWTVLILDEIDHIQHDSNYDPSDFFYRLLRGERKLDRGIQLSAWLISNELLEVDLQLDSRVESAMGNEEIFFPPYRPSALGEVLVPRLQQAFAADALPHDTLEYGITKAGRQWGDARKALRLFRRAGETATERGLDQVSRECIDANLDATEKEATVEKLTQLPLRHVLVLEAVTGRKDPISGEVLQPVTTQEVHGWFEEDDLPDRFSLGQRAVREAITDLETMGLVDTWIDNRGADGRVKQVEITFDPDWLAPVRERVYAERVRGESQSEE